MPPAAVQLNLRAASSRLENMHGPYLCIRGRRYLGAVAPQEALWPVSKKAWARQM